MEYPTTGSLPFSRYTHQPLGENVHRENAIDKWDIPWDIAFTIAIMVYEP